MARFHRLFKWIMLAAGLMTCSMFYALFAPAASLQANFGEGIDGAVAEIVVRNWGALIGLMGVLLIVGAFRREVRTVALLVAGASKLVFIALVLSLGQAYLPFQVGMAVAIDAVMLTLFAIYLLTHSSPTS